MVQGRFLFISRIKILAEQAGLNPFGSGTFFIRILCRKRYKSHFVLIPLVQGRFLFTRESLRYIWTTSLNPFGSGTFFINTDFEIKKGKSVLMKLVD